jgi:hypothetical protein
MNIVFVVQYREHAYLYIDQVYCVTETEEDAIIACEILNGLDEVATSGYEKVDYVTYGDFVEKD